jgi:hypothetical protein
MTSPEARNCDLPLRPTLTKLRPRLNVHVYRFLAAELYIDRTQAHLYLSPSSRSPAKLTRQTAAAFLQWWRAQSQEAARS